ncbi:MAG TPA: 3'-5' exonuclease, partial [Porphyromonadaceae bacterium]|nr:3'-5' exonuclease [Porphyromonadaceae bacterium]
MPNRDIVLRESISKGEVILLPVEKFQGEIEVVTTPQRAEEVMTLLGKEKVVGIDTETKPNFVTKEKNKVALLQISTLKKCFLLR